MTTKVTHTLTPSTYSEATSSSSNSQPSNVHVEQELTLLVQEFFESFQDLKNPQKPGKNKTLIAAKNIEVFTEKHIHLSKLYKNPKFLQYQETLDQRMATRQSETWVATAQKTVDALTKKSTKFYKEAKRVLKRYEHKFGPVRDCMLKMREKQKIRLAKAETEGKTLDQKETSIAISKLYRTIIKKLGTDVPEEIIQGYISYRKGINNDDLISLLNKKVTKLTHYFFLEESPSLS